MCAGISDQCFNLSNFPVNTIDENISVCTETNTPDHSDMSLWRQIHGRMIIYKNVNNERQGGLMGRCFTAPRLAQRSPSGETQPAQLRWCIYAVTWRHEFIRAARSSEHLGLQIIRMKSVGACALTSRLMLGWSTKLRGETCGAERSSCSEGASPFEERPGLWLEQTFQGLDQEGKTQWTP